MTILINQLMELNCVIVIKGQSHYLLALFVLLYTWFKSKNVFFFKWSILQKPFCVFLSLHTNPVYWCARGLVSALDLVQVEEYNFFSNKVSYKKVFVCFFNCIQIQYIGAREVWFLPYSSTWLTRRVCVAINYSLGGWECLLIDYFVYWAELSSSCRA